MVVRIVSTCGFPASIRFAISRVLSCVPVGRKSTDDSFIFAIESEDVRVVELGPGRLPARFRPLLRDAIRSMIVDVIFAPAGVLKAPPRLSLFCAIAGAQITSTSEIKNQTR